MGIARRRSRFHGENDNDLGLLLTEHRRCVDPIIAYCNELAYQNRIIPKRGYAGLKDPHPWPHMGYAHITGESRKEADGSRSNPMEASSIAAWLAEEKERLLAHYGRASLDECVGIITPFKAQMREIQKALGRNGVTLAKSVGTVHVFQGAERPVILFSPAYSRRDRGMSFFFDRSPNMLNVAVSRARDSFLVFGDMNIFDRASSTPSGLLVKHLNNEIPVAPARGN